MTSSYDNFEIPQIDQEIAALQNEDQADRKGDNYDTHVQEVNTNDARRLARAKELYVLYRQGVAQLKPESLYGLALVFQHSPVVQDKEGNELPNEDYKIAFELAKAAYEQGYAGARNLLTRAEDRYLLSVTGRQKWGTQSYSVNDGPEELSPMMSDEESGVNDEMRKEMGLPTLAEKVEEIKKESNKKG